MGKIKRILLRHLFIAVAAFFLASVTFIISMDKFFIPWVQRTGSEIEVPDLRGAPVKSAENILALLNLSLIVVEDEYNELYPDNVISFQAPSMGTIVKPGRRIRVKVSKGTIPLEVPDVVGTSPRDARLMIQTKGLYVLDEYWVASNIYPSGIVAAQDPPALSNVAKNSGVILSISNGKRVTDVTMPNLLELSYPEALDTLRVYNFNLSKVRKQFEVQPNLLPETVIDQYPDPGTPASTDNDVDIIVSSPKTEDIDQ